MNTAFGTHRLIFKEEETDSTHRFDLWIWCLGFGVGSLVVQFFISMFSKLFLKKWLSYDYTLNYTITESKDLEAAVTSPGDLRYFLSGMSAKSNVSHVSTSSRIVDNVVRTGRSQRASQHFAEYGSARRSGTLTTPLEAGPEREPEQDREISL